MVFRKNSSALSGRSMELQSPESYKNDSQTLSFAAHARIRNAILIKYSSAAAQLIHFQLIILIYKSNDKLTNASATTVSLAFDLVQYTIGSKTIQYQGRKRKEQ